MQIPVNKKNANGKSSKKLKPCSQLRSMKGVDNIKKVLSIQNMLEK
jgi:hypothetical protein